MAESGNNKSPSSGPPPAAEILRLANIIYFRSHVFDRTEWMGYRAAKCPMDMWVYQELMHKLGTDLLIETGTLLGGSALFFAHMFDIMGHGKVISVDIEIRENLPSHPRIEYIEGSSVSTEVLEQVSAATKTANSVIVLLDSDHKAPYKLEEMRLYSKFVTPGSYMIAEDTCFDAYPAFPEYGPGPAAAVKKFMSENSDFATDRSLEQHLISFVPGGFLRRK
jgi:cephalosporin hydroxylase